MTDRRHTPAYESNPNANPLQALLAAEPWMADALCPQTDPDAFFPDKGGSTREAKAICASCQVAAECLDYSLEHGERFGIWGGLSERERRRLMGWADDGDDWQESA